MEGPIIYNLAPEDYYLFTMLSYTMTFNSLRNKLSHIPKTITMHKFTVYYCLTVKLEALNSSLSKPFASLSVTK